MEAPSPCCTLPSTVLHCHQWQAPSDPELPTGRRRGPTARTGPGCPTTLLPQKPQNLVSQQHYSMHPCCRNYILLLFIGLSHIYFYLGNVTNLYSTEARFLDVPVMVHFHYFELASPFRFASLAGFHFK